MTTSTVVNDLICSVPRPRMTSRDDFVAFLKFVHGVILASEPLLQIAVQKSSGALRDFFQSHLGEERDHASWLADDLKLFGEATPRIDHAAAATAGAQYYYLHHIGPHPLLGYMAALEFQPMPLADVDALEKLYGAPALRTVRHHATHDPEHAKELARVIDQQEEFADLIAYSAFVTSKMVSFYLAERMRHATTC